MTLNSSVRRNIGFAALFSLLLALLPFGPSVTVADASPSAGSCARDGDGTLVCNVLNQNLDFSRSGDTTQSGGWVPSNNIDATAENSVTYSSVFTGGGYTIDAVVFVESKTGTGVVLDANGSSGSGAFPDGFNNTAIVMLAQQDSQIEVTVTFQDSASKEAVTMHNLTVLVIDIDGHESGRDDVSKEFATFQGLNGYKVTSATQLNVSTSEDEPSFSGGITPGNESTSPESGVRQFYTEEGVGTGITRHSADVDENNAVAVTFPPTSTVGFVAGTYGGIAGTIAFTFGPANFGAGVSTLNTLVSSGSHTITYDLDGGSGTAPDPVTTSVAVNLSSGTGITKSSIPISRWSTQSGGAGTKYNAGASFTPPKDITFYAVYGYRVTFDGNLGTGSMNPQDASGSTALTANAFTRTGYAFAGWNTEANGSGTAYANGAAFPFTADDTLYAQWAQEFDVSFDPNGGSGSMSAQTAGGSTALTANAFTRTGYAFAGWNTEANGSGTPYVNGATFPFTADDILYAQWTLAPAGSSGGTSGGSSASNAVVTPTTPIATPRQTRLTLVGPNTDPVPRPVERLGLRFDPDAPSRATVGGAPTNLVKTPVGSDGLSVAAGAFQFGVSLADADGAEVQTDTPSQSPELFVPRGQSAAVSGKGSYPGSFVQLFLPGDGNDSRELARIPVRSDGTFASDLSFQAGALELPVPIGRQVLQVVGYDELGNQTVVDMTVNIGQGVPAPEPNRQIGELPALTAGQSLATSGGIPETVSVTGVPETGNVVVEGSGWVISVNADRDNGVVETSDGNVLVRLNPSSVGTTFGNGFLPGTLATVWLFSEPTLMTTVTVDDNGEFSAEFLVDARLIAPGEHTLQVQGVGSDGYIKAANLGVLVEQPVEVTAESASGLLWWIVGAFLLVLLFLLLLLGRRRRSQEQ